MRRLMLRNWQRLIDLSARPGKPSIIVWPEAATGFAVAREPGALDEIGLFTARGQTLITGSDRVVPGPARLIAYNSLYVFGPRGALPQVYDKFHLVPFGEYVPFAQSVEPYRHQPADRGRGLQRRRSSPCDAGCRRAGDDAPDMLRGYLPAAVTDPNAPRPGWFVNITDDSWFGPWAGPCSIS